MDAASGLKMMFLAATDRDALSVSLLFIIIIFISFSLENLYPLTLLFLPLSVSFIINDWICSACLLCT